MEYTKKILNFQGILNFHLVTVLQGALMEFKALLQKTALKTIKGFLFKSGSQCCMKRQCKQLVVGVYMSYNGMRISIYPSYQFIFFRALYISIIFR